MNQDFRRATQLALLVLMGCSGDPSLTDGDNDSAAFVPCEGEAAPLDPNAQQVGQENELYSGELVKALCESGEVVDVLGSISFNGLDEDLKLEHLSCVQSVAGSLSLHEATELDLADLSGLLAVGSLVIDDGDLTTLAGLETVAPAVTDLSIDGDSLSDLSALQCANTLGTLIIGGTGVTDLSGFSGLRVLSGRLRVEHGVALEDATLPTLESVVGDVELRFSAGLTRASFPALVTAGGVELYENDVLLSVEAPLVGPMPTEGSVFDANFGWNPMLETVVLGEGDASMPLNLTLTDSPALHILTGLGGFRELATLDISGTTALREMPPLAVTKASGDVLIVASGVTSLGFLSDLRTVGGSLTITDNLNLTQGECEAFAAQVTVGGTVTVSGNGG
ncbi:hypothetical protein LBMAG42_56590 [Deltaproteobacteria bacterium]|nr:hypothetical protein LBMAG42_56590 [Deltaproteobacteria bacterium]